MGVWWDLMNEFTEPFVLKCSDDRLNGRGGKKTLINNVAVFFYECVTTSETKKTSFFFVSSQIILVNKQLFSSTQCETNR